MSKKVYNGEIKTKTGKPKATTTEILRKPVKYEEPAKLPETGLDSYAYGLDNNIILL